MGRRALIACALLGAARTSEARHQSELLGREAQEALGIVWCGNHSASHDRLPLALAEVPKAFNWCNFGGEGKDATNYCAASRNQHVPQYCGSCWAFAALSALDDRIKIARNAIGPDIALSTQHMLNCGYAGSCNGGSLDGPYQWLMDISNQTGSGISYETSLPYMACSSDYRVGLCRHGDYTCTAVNVARTCGGFKTEGGSCTGLRAYPNATISDYGSISGPAAMKREIFSRGPIACEVDSNPLLNYEEGVISTKGGSINHVVSVVGWGVDDSAEGEGTGASAGAAGGGGYWWVRNSWGEYWGEMGFARVAHGALLLEDRCSWAVPDTFTSFERRNQARHCHEGGDNCLPHDQPFSVQVM